MECIVAIGAIVVFSLAAYFYVRLRELDKKSRQIDVLKLEVQALWAKLGVESGEAIIPVAPSAATPSPVARAPLPAAPVAKPVPPATPIPATQPQLTPQYNLVTEANPALSVAAPIAVPVATPMPVPVAVAPKPVAAQNGPSLADRIPNSPLLRWFMGSHMVVRVGILILFIGVAFLLKYAADQGWFSIELRLASAGALGVGLVYTGWRLRAKQRIYALTLQGGGLGIAYLTTFAGFRIYELLPAPLAFALLVGIGIVCGALAVLNDAKALALPAIVGGFAAPFLVSTGEGSHVTLFSYFALLNAAILLIAWYKSWRELNLVGFVFTFVLATVWGGQYYQPEFLGTVEPFLLLFFVFYLTIGLLFARRQVPQLVGLVDGPIVFGTPVIVMLWQARLVSNTPYGLAWSAAGMGLLYLLLFVTLRRASANYATLRQSYLAIGTVLVSLAVPLAVDGQLTSAVWALAGVGILWAGLRQQRRFHTLWGGILQLGAAYFFAAHVVIGLFDDMDGTVVPTYWLGLFESLVVGGVMVALAALLTGYLLMMAARRGEQLVGKGDLNFLAWGATLWGLAWWYGTGLYAIGRYWIYDGGGLTPVALFFVLTAIVGEWLGGRFQWRAIRLTSLLLWAAIAPLAFFQAINYYVLLSGWGLLVWPAAVGVHYWMLRRLDHVAALRIYHSIGLWLLTGLLMLDVIVRDYTWQGNTLWSVLAVMSVPLLLVLLVSLFGKQLPWPTGKHITHYMTVGLAPLLLILVLMSVINNLSHDGDSTPLAYVPLLNPVSLAHLSIFGALAIWLTQLRKIVANPRSLRPLWILGACLFFLWFNADVARIVHHFWDVPFEASALLQSSLLQAVYSIIWTLLAMALMFSGTRSARRWVWLVGASLLGLTVIKLLVLDLSAADTLARIVSFIVVGLLMLLIGYFSPIPPLAPREEVAGS